MEEYSRAIIEHYWPQHQKSQKEQRMMRPATLSYDPGTIGDVADALYLEGMIRGKKPGTEGDLAGFG